MCFPDLWQLFRVIANSTPQLVLTLEFRNSIVEWMNEWIVYFLFSKNYYDEKRTWMIAQWLHMGIICNVNCYIPSRDVIPYCNVPLADRMFTQLHNNNNVFYYNFNNCNLVKAKRLVMLCFCFGSASCSCLVNFSSSVASITVNGWWLKSKYNLNKINVVLKFLNGII